MTAEKFINLSRCVCVCAHDNSVCVWQQQQLNVSHSVCSFVMCFICRLFSCLPLCRAAQVGKYSKHSVSLFEVCFQSMTIQRMRNIFRQTSHLYEAVRLNVPQSSSICGNIGKRHCPVPVTRHNPRPSYQFIFIGRTKWIRLADIYFWSGRVRSVASDCNAKN